MALEGTLRDFSLADILQLISLQHKTGLLTVRGPADTVTLGFLDGMLVSAESTAQRLDTRLGTVLVKTRRLTAEGLARALEMQAQTLQRLGFILLKNGFCSAQDLRDGLDIQIKRIAYGLFRWTDGDYVFEQTEQVDYDTPSTTSRTPRSHGGPARKGSTRSVSRVPNGPSTSSWTAVEPLPRSTSWLFCRSSTDARRVSTS